MLVVLEHVDHLHAVTADLLMIRLPHTRPPPTAEIGSRSSEHYGSMLSPPTPPTPTAPLFMFSA